MTHTSHYPENAASWAQYRETITQLYHRDGLGLSQMMVKMSKVHGFKATPVLRSNSYAPCLRTTSVKMYKTKIKAWDLTKYNTGHRRSRLRLTPASKPALESTIPRRKHRISSFAETEVVNKALCDDANAQVIWGLVPVDSLYRIIHFDERVDHFLQTTRVYLDFAAGRESWRSVPSLLISPHPSNFSISRRFQEPYNEPVVEWELNAFERRDLGLECSFFNDIMTSICYAARADYENAGDCWRSASRSIEAAIDTEDPELYVALIWSIALLDRWGCGEVVIQIQEYVSGLIRLQANRVHPLFPVLTCFAKIPQPTICWLKGVVLNIIFDWSIALSQQDSSFFQVYFWSSLPSADGLMRIISTSFTDFKTISGKDTAPVGSHENNNVAESLIFLARRKRI